MHYIQGVGLNCTGIEGVGLMCACKNNGLHNEKQWNKCKAFFEGCYAAKG